ncbi:TRAP transporter large permease [Halomonas elongata]|uniref:TRAP transporter large permease protein n=1 Tax=Halomonas elongata (strain ATCC 33173 / DSM 2581 / NBRC 15536 / NCIMB 2198 / 1H9) TaxID=768066 RepID=E1V499_HALED|nr:TRAP transporter large permease [Halomonas elongata]WBF18178.1 TRAP transporter large permease [Halomonas elongata]WPU47029.1 TRAP transporter large permease [Halomonas elongata DSM 2581]CBV40936.1 TRAP transporter large transmembrane protein (probable substrate D-galactonate) [Halomonas elongata DSM 2581]
MILWSILVGLVICIVIGLPISFGLAAISLFIFFYADYSLSPIVAQAVNGLDSFPLLAIPLFILVGEVMSQGGIAKRLVRLASALVGFIAGGLGQVAVLTSMFFGGISGSAVADASAVGSMMIEPMKQHRYSGSLATAIVVAASVVGIIIPPSIPMILFGVVTNTSISELFMAGIVPGVLITLGLAVTTFLQARKTGKGQPFDIRELWLALKESVLALLLPVIIVGGILSGVFTPTESAAVALIYAIVVSMFVYRSLTLKRFFRLCITTGRLTGVVMLLLAFASVLAWLLTANMIPQQLVVSLSAITENKLLLLLLLSLFLLVVGFFMDLTPAMVVLAPLMTPVVVKLGIDPVYFGVLMSFILGLGLITPPVGTVLYVGCGVGRVGMEQLVKSLLPFYLTLLLLLAAFLIFPGLILWYQ